MIQLITTEIELSTDEIKEAITNWLYNKDIINEDMKIDFVIGCEYIDITAKITFTKSKGMTEFKGTKGNWRLFNNGKEYYQGIECDTETGTKTIVLYGDRGEGAGVRANHDGTREEMNANAYLITSAPELLQACISSLELFESLNRHGEPLAHHEYDNASAALKSAINKALNK